MLHAEPTAFFLIRISQYFFVMSKIMNLPFNTWTSAQMCVTSGCRVTASPRNVDLFWIARNYGICDPDSQLIKLLRWITLNPFSIRSCDKYPVVLLNLWLWILTSNTVISKTFKFVHNKDTLQLETMRKAYLYMLQLNLTCIPSMLYGVCIGCNPNINIYQNSRS